MFKYLLTTLLLINYSFALDLNSLLNNVKQSSNKELSEERKRLNEFIQNKEEQKKFIH